MKLTALILTCYLALLTGIPAVCSTYTMFQQADICCTDRNCSQKGDCKKESNNSCTPCCSIQSCNCSIIDIPRFNFSIQSSIANKQIPAENDKAFSEYSADCWRPPELI